MREIIIKLPELLREAGKIMLSAHGVEEGENIVEKSGTANFVTGFDVRVQEFLKEKIKEILPDAVFIAEEQENDDSALDRDYCFIIDPIDGTTNFIHDYHHSAISLALVSHGETVFGAVYDPYMDELFSAEKGKGCFVNGVRVSPSSHSMKTAVAAFGTSPYQKNEMGPKAFRIAEELFYHTADVRRCGSAALDMAYVAAGRNDIYVELVLLPWDIAAAALLVTEAGCVITDANGNPITLNGSVSAVAATKALHADVLRMIQKHL